MPVLAADLGGTKTTVAHVDARGIVTGRRTLAAARSLDASIAQIVEAAGDASAVGIIVPGIYTPATGHAWCPNLWGAAEQPLLAAVRAHLRLPVAIDSDRAGYVLGEAWLGAARGVRHAAFVAIGTGIGVGVLADGAVLRGSRGIAGAAGWFALGGDWNEEYRVLGAWEAVSAGPAIARAYGAGEARVVVEAARAGDARARAVLDRAARHTGKGVANLISLLDPDAVILGGGVMQGAGDLLLDTIRSEARRWAQPIAAARCRIEMSHLGENAGLLGAARLAFMLA